MRTFLFFTIFGFAVGAATLVAVAWVDPTASPPAGAAPAPINATGVGQTKGGGLNVATGSGARFGIGTTNPSSLLSVGTSSQFQVNDSGNIVRMNDIPASWPAAQGAASTLLRNDGSGNLSWQSQASTTPGLNLRFTRAVVASASTLAQRDAQCVTEFGSDYYTAERHDVAVYAPLGATINNQFRTSTSVANLYVLFADTANGFSYLTFAVLADSPVACVRKNAPLLFTRNLLLWSSTLAIKDAQCESEFGSKYRTASELEVATYAHLGSGIQFLVDSSGTTNVYSDTVNDFSYLNAQASSGSHSVACIKFAP